MTFDDTFTEGIGDALVVSGGSAALGARTPKRYSLTLPVHGTSLDADEYGAGARMRRQVRSLFENGLARAQGLYLNAWLDPEQNGWLMVGSATIDYVNGGVTLGEYSLVVDEVYRVASDRAYRPGRRLDLFDRRLSTTYRDFLGGRTSTDFANLTGDAYGSGSSFCFLPPNAVDVTGVGRALQASYPIFSREGQVVLVQGQQSGSVLNYEQPATSRHLADVVVHDRRGQGNGSAPYTNLVTNPSFETGTTGWSGSASSRLTGGATLTRAASGSAYSGGYVLQVATTASSNEGADFAAIPVVVGQPYAATVFVRGNAGGEQVQIVLGDGTVGQATAGAALTTSWKALAVTLTPTASGTTGLAVRTTTATAWTFFLDAASVTQTAAAVAYFDGSTPGCAWTGPAGASTSTGPGGWVNAIRNGSAKAGVGNWALTGAGGALASSVAQSTDAPWGSGDSLDVSLSGVTSSALAPGGATPTDLLATAFGGTVYVEAMVRLVNALPANATLSLRVTWLSAASASISSSVAATLSSSQASGSWVRLSGTLSAPAGAYLAAFGVATAGHATTDSIRYRLANVLLTEATALGPPPVYNPLGYPGTRFFDGDSALSGWTGTRAASVPVQWLDPQDSPGWEEAYGGEHQLVSGDVPVLSNGIVRVRAERGAAVSAGTALVFAVDWAYPAAQTSAGALLGGGGWTEVGRWSFALGTAANVAAWSLLTSAAVVEWTPDRAVLRASLSGSFGGAARHVDLYVTLQRGWGGPRFEVYDAPPSGTASTDYYTLFAPNYPSPVAAVGTRLDGQGTGVGSAIGTETAGGLATGLAENWISVAPLQAVLQPVVHLAREWDDAGFTWLSVAPAANALYASGSQALVTQHFVQPGTPIWYFSQLLSVARPGYGSPAPAIRNSGSGTTAQVADAAAISGQAVTETQTAATNPTLLSGALAVPFPGTYGVWVRAKGTGSNTVTFRASAPTGGGARSRPVGSSGALPGSASDRVWASAAATYTWVYVGEIPQAAITDLSLTAWVSAGSVTIDSILAVPTTRPASAGATFDGGRDVGAGYLYDSRTTAETVQR